MKEELRSPWQFAKDSYDHIVPRGKMEHVQFVACLPIAIVKYYYFYLKDAL